MHVTDPDGDWGERNNQRDDWDESNHMNPGREDREREIE